MSLRTILARLGIVRDDLTPHEKALILLAAYPPEDHFGPVLLDLHQVEDVDGS